MAIRFKCKKCGQELNVRDELGGKQGKCPKCQSILNVPAPAAAPAQTPGAVRTAAPKKKADEAEDDIAEVEIVDDPPRKSKGKDTAKDDFNFDDVDEDEPRKKSKSSSRRRDDDDEDDDDDRPRKKKRRDDDDDDEDDRPRSRRRRDDDDDDDEEDNRSKQSPKKRRAALRRATMGVFLTSVGNFVYAGALTLSMFCFLIIIMSIPSQPGFGGGGGKTLYDIIKILGWIVMLGFVGAMITAVVGASFIITTPAKKGTLGMAIATLATTAMSLLLFVIAVINMMDDRFGTGMGMGGFTIGYFTLNPFAGVGDGRTFLGLFSGNMGFVIYMLPLLEVGRLTCFAFYQWAVARSFKDRDTARSAMLLGIITPSVCAGVGLIMWILTTSIKNMGKGGALVILLVYFVSYIGVIGYYAFASLSAKETLEGAR